MVILKVFNFFTNSEENLNEIFNSIKLICNSCSNWINYPLSKNQNNNINDNNNDNTVDNDILENKSMEFNEKSIGFLKAPQIIQKNGYPIEIHKIETSDGYLLEMHRIPRPGATPVYLQHGVLDSSASWIIMGPEQSLAYILYDYGYDVWLGNNRGNTYSKKHKSLNSKCGKFWDFTIHEIGTIDIPTMFDYIINETKYSRIHYVGHSQGATAFFIMCQSMPEYCNKTLSVNLLAPVAYLKYTKSPFLRMCTFMLNTLNFLGKVLNINQVCPRTHILAIIGHLFFHERAITQAIFTNILFMITGYNSEQLNKSMVPAMAGHIPAGASRNQLIHFGQLINSGNFQMYDHGKIKNNIIYGQNEPPNYDLTKVNVPITLYYSLNDWLADLKDVKKLIEQLPNVVAKYEILHPKFNHMDFLFATDVKRLVYDHVIEVMRKHENVDNVSGCENENFNCEINMTVEINEN